MSVIICNYCSKYIDTDFDVEHEEMCKQEHEALQDEANAQAEYEAEMRAADEQAQAEADAKGYEEMMSQMEQPEY